MLQQDKWVQDASIEPGKQQTLNDFGMKQAHKKQAPKPSYMRP
jgi:hypothetical protein